MTNPDHVLRAMRALTDERQSHAVIADKMRVSQPEAFDVLSWMVDAGLANAHGGNEWTAGSEPRRLRAIEQAARDFLSAIGETADDIPGRARPALLVLRALMHEEGR